MMRVGGGHARELERFVEPGVRRRFYWERSHDEDYYSILRHGSTSPIRPKRFS